MTVPVPFNQQKKLGRGKIGEIPFDVAQRCNEWLDPLAKRDGFLQTPSLAPSDIRNLLDLGRQGYTSYSNGIEGADPLRTMLLIDMATVTKVIRWGAAPQEEAPTTEVYFRLTARGRRMLQQCCKDLWEQMLYGQPEAPLGSHKFTGLGGTCAFCAATDVMIEDAIVSKECPDFIPPKGKILSLFRRAKYIADGAGGFFEETSS